MEATLLSRKNNKSVFLVSADPSRVFSANYGDIAITSGGVIYECRGGSVWSQDIEDGRIDAIKRAFQIAVQAVTDGPVDPWAEGPYSAGDQVVHNDKLWVATASITDEEPGISGLWSPAGAVISVFGKTGTVIAAIANQFAIVDQTDQTKKIVASVAGATTGKTLTLASSHSNNRTITFPDATTTLVGNDNAEVVKNKTIQHPKTAYNADGAIGVAVGLATLTKGSAGAYTLAAPSEAQEGIELTIISQSAFAHVVTATNLIDDGVTGGAKDTMTFAAFVGASITLVALNQKWSVKSKNNVTVAAV